MSDPPKSSSALSKLKGAFQWGRKGGKGRKDRKGGKGGKGGKGHADAASLDPTVMLELRIDSSFVRLYPPAQPISNDTQAAAAMAPGTGRVLSDSICILRGPLEAFLRYSRQEASRWLIDLAHDICDPADSRGMLVVWKNEQWQDVDDTDPLTATTYRYDLPVGTIVGLSKISHRQRRSVTSPTGNASTMASRVKRRDGSCWVTGGDSPLVNSHICPKRMGDHLGRLIFRTFTSSAPDPNLSIYDEIFGLCLTEQLDAWFDDYELGFRFVSLNNYECHVFGIEPFNMVYTVVARVPRPSIFPDLHGYHAAPPRPEADRLPPPGLFRWHYLQCVLKRFGHEDFNALDNIVFYQLPLPMEEDSDDEGTDSEFDWPSKGLDLGRVAQDNLEECEERHQAVAKWISTTM